MSGIELRVCLLVSSPRNVKKRTRIAILDSKLYCIIPPSDGKQ